MPDLTLPAQEDSVIYIFMVVTEAAADTCSSTAEGHPDIAPAKRPRQMAKKMRVEVAWISGAVVSFAAFRKKAVRFNSSNLFRRSRTLRKVED